MCDYRMSHASPVPGFQLVKPSEMANGAIAAREAWVGMGHYALDPKPPRIFFRSSATSARFSIALRFNGRTLGAG